MFGQSVKSWSESSKSKPNNVRTSSCKYSCSVTARRSHISRTANTLFRTHSEAQLAFQKNLNLKVMTLMTLMTLMTWLEDTERLPAEPREPNGKAVEWLSGLVDSSQLWSVTMCHCGCCFARLTQRGRQEEIADVKCGAEKNTETKKSKRKASPATLLRQDSVRNYPNSPDHLNQSALPNYIYLYPACDFAVSRLSEAAVFEERPLTSCKGNRSFFLDSTLYNPCTTGWKAMEGMVPFQGFDLLVLSKCSHFTPFASSVR